MRSDTIILLMTQLWRSAFKSASMYVLMALLAPIMVFAAYSGWKSYTVQNDIREHYQGVARESWANNPDKHPHRMAHYGTFAFRLKHPLSMFDFGMESFTGNAVYLEAHRQNTVNFSEASFSTGLLRFGEISMAMVLQVIIPLVIFFLGFSSISSDRQTGTLKILLIQGVTWKEILFGRTLGLLSFSLIFFAPATITITILLLGIGAPDGDVFGRCAGIILSYVCFYGVLCTLTTIVSAVSSSSQDALVRLLGIWLFFVILLPRTTQAIGSYLYPSPSKAAFEAGLERDIIKQGDSHNPDDAHYKAIKDSLLTAHRVDSVNKLPFNYGGFIMREGERLSALTFQRHLKKLLNSYEDQNRLNRLSAFVNPYVAIRNVSRALSGTDFSSYVHFQNEAEAYRYKLAQTMNELQMKYISNSIKTSADKSAIIHRKHWEEFPDFQYKFQSVSESVSHEAWSVAALGLWLIGVVILALNLSRKLKAI